MADTVANFPPDVLTENAPRGRILVIDDEPDIRDSLEALLSSENYRVELAANATEGLKRLENSAYDLVLLDLMMPRLNGYEFIERIGTLPVPRPHIIVFTAAGKRGVDKIPPDSICASILKPFDLEKFIELIDDCLGKDMPHK